MNPFVYLAKKYYYKHQTERVNSTQNINETINKSLYSERYSPKGKIKVHIHQTGFSREFTRFMTSSDDKEFSFYLTGNPDEADAIVFINAVDNGIPKPGQRIILFFHEPHDYAHLYQSKIDWHKLKNCTVEVISHLPDPSIFLANPDGIKYTRSIPYVHFHHMARYDELKELDEMARERQVCSITSGFSGIPGYKKRKDFIEKLALTNKNFDLFGRFSKQSASLRAYHGPCITKWKTLGAYQYSLVIENSDDDYYISEKIFDALICGCMPIYHGSSKIFEIVPKNWFYYLPTLDESAIQDLNRFLTTDAYRVVSESRGEIAETIYEKYSFYRALDNLLLGTPLSVIPT